MGNIQRLNNGNSLIGWGHVLSYEPNVTEYESDGTKVFEMFLDLNSSVKSSYRAYRFVWPDLTNLLENISENDYLFSNYPNPFSASTTIFPFAYP